MRRDVFQAISDPIRREILDLLVDGHLNVNSIAGKFDVSRPAISKHIKILVECGLVVITKNGRERFCELDRKSLVPAFLWMDQFKKSWEDRMDRFEDYINKQQSNENKENG